MVVAGGDGSVDLEITEHALDAIALFVERRSCSICTRRFDRPGDDCLDLPFGKVGTDGVNILAFVGEQRERCPLWQVDEVIKRFAVCCLADSQVEGERSSEGISQAVKLTGEPAPRAAKSASMSPPFPPAAETWARTVVLSML